MTVLTILPPRESYSSNSAGAISLLVSRLALPDDTVLGSPVEGMPLSGGRFRPVKDLGHVWHWLSHSARYQLSCQCMARRLRPRLIEVHNKPQLALAMARFAPVQLILHNDPQEMRGARSPREREKLLSKLHVITVSDWLRRRFLEDVDAAPVTVMPNCIDLADLPPRAEPRAREILFVGRIVADKGVDAFVRAWGNVSRRLPGWSAGMIGADRFQKNAPRTAFVNAVERDADAVGVAHWGYQPHAVVLEAMARASIVVVPSRWLEPFGLTALEAMASGAAVIASRNGGLPEVVGDVALYASPDVPDQLESVILRLASNDSERKALSERGLVRSKQFDVIMARQRLCLIRKRTMELSGPSHR